MNFKLFAPLSALALLAASCSAGDDLADKKGTGTLNPEFTINYTIHNSRAESRADGDPTASVIPEAKDFTFTLTRKDGKKEPETFTELSSLQNISRGVGAYTLEAYYPAEEDEGIDKAYYYGTTEFNVYDGEVAQPSITATLANTAVEIEYTDAFKKYFTDYHTTLHSSNGTKNIEMAKDESRWAYLKPGDISLNVAFTKQNGKSSEMEVAKIEDAQARTIYHVTIDVNDGEIGNPQISIAFDAETATEPVTVDVSDEALDAPQPVITPTGYNSSTTIELLEGDEYSSPLKAAILARGGLSSENAEVRLTVSSPTPGLAEFNSKDINLLKATEEQQAALKNMGIECKGLWNNPNGLATVDFTKLIQNLQVVDGVSTHTFTLAVVDNFKKTCEPVVLTVKAPKPILTLSNPGKLAFDQTTVDFDITFNGDISKVKVQTKNDYGVFEDRTYTVSSLGENKYHATATIPASENDAIIRAVYNKTISAELTSARKVVLYDVKDGDVWAHTATLQIAPASSASKVTKVTLNGSELSNPSTLFSSSTGIMTLTGLTPSTKYSVEVTVSGESEPLTAEFTTEAATEVPNGDFETLTQTISISNMKQSGIWAATKYGTSTQNTCSFNVKEPTGWASVNSKTCNTGASNQNSWFVIPSTYNTTLSWLSTVPDYKLVIGNYGGGGTETPDIYKNLAAQHGNNAMVVRNVAWDSNGNTPEDDKSSHELSYGRDDYYNHNVPNIANRSAGKLFLGSYSYSNGVETYNEGVSFSSRPQALKGFYKYANDGTDASETGMVTVTLLNGDNIIGTGTANLVASSDYKEFSVAINYTDASKKATKLKIMITSSNHASYSQAEETASIKTSNYTSRYESASRGATLTIDNLTFDYK